MKKGIGIDLGGTNLRVWHTAEGLVMQEPALAALDRDSGRIVKFGTAADELFKGQNPPNVTSSRPFKNGVVHQCEIAQKVFAWCRKRCSIAADEPIRALLSIPCDLNDVEQSALIEVAVQAGFREPYLVDAPLAALYGVGFSTSDSVLMVHIGSTKTDIMAIHGGECVYKESCSAAGDMFDDAIVAYCMKRYRVRLHTRTAETVKNRIGTVWVGGPSQALTVGCTDESGNRQRIQISSEEMFTILEEPMASLIEGICKAISSLPLNAVTSIFDTGVVLTGGGARLEGLAKMISGVTGVRCRLAESPELSVVRGLGALLKVAPGNIRSGCINFSEFLLQRN